FAILSLPPLVFGLAGTIGYVAKRYQVARVDELKRSILEASSQALTDGTVNQVVRPTLDDVLSGGRIDVISIGFLLALWSGSRALNVIIDTITIMYGLGGRRGIVKTRVLSFGMYVVALVIGVVVVPLILAGPGLVRDVVPDDLRFVEVAYWPTVIVLTIAFLTTLYHVAVPVRTSWAYGIPGAVFTMLLWIFGSMLTRWVLQGSVGSTSIYGPLSAPIAILLWLYVLSIAVLIGAALNASVDRVHPSRNTARARSELLQRLRQRARITRGRAPEWGEPDELDRDIEEQERRVREDGRAVPPAS
ncbi:MAG: YihY/virulence factor BrkB family protein, partial [Nocardioidaceae bacterium]